MKDQQKFATGRWIRVSIPEQALWLMEGNGAQANYPVSTARNGPGEQRHSETTPRGWHKVRAKIGAGLPPGAVLVARRPTGEVFSENFREAHPDRDWILTRILWLSGLEPGFNRLGEVDTMRRFIYIHGCPDTDAVGSPGSHGCIRMRNAHVVKLFEKVPIGTRVLIEE